MTIQCIIFAEFDNDLGPKITYQYPSGENFDVIHEYIITKPNVSSRLITIAFGYKFMGFPIVIEHEKYKRNALFFNLCFVFHEDIDTSHYEATLRKLALTLKSLEQESEFIFNSASKSKIQDFIKEVFIGLNREGECVLPVDQGNTVYLKIFPKLQPPAPVLDHEVPLFIRDVHGLVTKDWDLSLQQILPCIDGVNHIKRISGVSCVDIHTVKRLVQHLLYFRTVVMIDIFQWTNVYTTTPQIHQLITFPKMQKECISYITKSDSLSPTIDKVIGLYCELHGTSNVKDFSEENQLETLNIDERRFFTFGLVNRFLRRIHKYPIKLPKKIKKEDKEQDPIKSMCDGLTSYDQICCSLERQFEDVDSLLKADKDIVILSK